MNRFTLLTVVIDHRSDAAVPVQDILTRNGCIIKTRLGLHEECEETGLIILQLKGDDAANAQLEKDLAAVKGVGAKLVQMEAPKE